MMDRAKPVLRRHSCAFAPGLCWYGCRSGQSINADHGLCPMPPGFAAAGIGPTKAGSTATGTGLPPVPAGCKARPGRVRWLAQRRRRACWKCLLPILWSATKLISRCAGNSSSLCAKNVQLIVSVPEIDKATAFARSRFTHSRNGSKTSARQRASREAKTGRLSSGHCSHTYPFETRCGYVSKSCRMSRKKTVPFHSDGDFVACDRGSYDPAHTAKSNTEIRIGAFQQFEFDDKSLFRFGAVPLGERILPSASAMQSIRPRPASYFGLPEWDVTV